MRSNHKTIATIAILIATFFWGMTFAFIKVAVSYTHVFNFLCWRFGIASLILYIIFHKQIVFSKRALVQGLILGLFISSTVIFQTIGLQYTIASTASFITGLSVILVAIISHILNRQLPQINVIAAVILAIFGVGLITLTSELTINIGDLLVLLCAFCFAFYIICTGTYSNNDKPFTLTFIQLITVFIISGIVDISMGNFTAQLMPKVWVSIIFCAIFASVIAFTLQIKFQKYLSATKTAIIFSSDPIFATITAIIYLDEKLTFKFIIGALCVFAAMLLSELKSKKKVLPQEAI